MQASLIEPAPGLGDRQSLSAMTILLVVGALALLTLAADRYGRAAALRDLWAKGNATLPIVAATLAGEIDSADRVSTFLARDRDVGDLLAHPDQDGDLLKRVRHKLKDLALETGVSVLYLMDANGKTIAASNAGTPDSFEKDNYSRRHYFQDALKAGAGFQYSRGLRTHRPGLYLSHRVVDDESRLLGVAVAKVELDRVEDRWQKSGYIVYAVEKDGIVTATSQSGWHFHKKDPLADEDAVRSDLQLESEPLKPLPVNVLDHGLVEVVEGGPTAQFAEVECPLDRCESKQAAAGSPAGAPDLRWHAVPSDWHVTVLLPADAVITTARRTTAMAAFLSGLGVVAGAAGALRWWRAARRRQAAMAELNTELERRVQERTTELSRANAALEGEIHAREKTETKVRMLRDELAQANRLSILGQVSASVAHEINQPVAAIRAYADNADRLLSIGRTGTARENMTAISRMADRIGEITGGLRSFARRATGQIEAVSLEDAIDGARALLAGRIRDSRVTLDRVRSARSPNVVASRIGLEQILVNLVQNALDAVRGMADPCIAIEVEDKGDAVTVAVRDNGPGVRPDVAENLFMPFVTTKEKGLGLGLVISGEIAREFGGDLRLESRPGEGATFVLELRRAA